MSNTTDRMTVAVIGCGRMGRLHADAVARSAHARLIAVCDVDRSRAEALASATGLRPWTSWREMLDTARPQVVTIATPDDQHVEPVLGAIDAGCHVFCEKPLTTDLAAARHIVAAARERGVQLAVNYNRRYGFAYRRAKQAIDEGVIGAVRLVSISVRDATPRPPLSDTPTVILTTLLTHHFDLVRWLGGEPTNLDATFQAPRVGEVLHRHVIIRLRLVHGALGSLVAGYQDGLRRTEERCEVWGDSGRLLIDDVTRRVVLSRDDPDQIEEFRNPRFDEGDQFWHTIGLHLEDFLARLAAGQPIAVTGVDGLRGLELAAQCLV